VHGVARWRLAMHSLALFEPMDAVLIDLACRDFRKHHAPEEWDQVTICTCMLSTSIGWTTLPLRDDVEPTLVQLRSFAEQFPAFQFTVAKLTSELQVPVLCELLCLRIDCLLSKSCVDSCQPDSLRIAS
jgi:hypothetical protein